MTRAAIYACGGYVAGLRPVEEQLADARALAARRKWKIVGEYADPVAQPRTLKDRAGIKKLVADVRDGDVDLIIAQQLDIILAAMADVPGLLRRAEFDKVRIVTGWEGDVTAEVKTKQTQRAVTANIERLLKLCRAAHVTAAEISIALNEEPGLRSVGLLSVSAHIGGTITTLLNIAKLIGMEDAATVDDFLRAQDTRMREQARRTIDVEPDR